MPGHNSYRHPYLTLVSGSWWNRRDVRSVGVRGVFHVTGKLQLLGRTRDMLWQTARYSCLLAEMAMRSEDEEASYIGNLTISGETAPRGVFHTPNSASRHD